MSMKGSIPHFLRVERPFAILLAQTALWSYRSLVTLVLCAGLVWTILAGWNTLAVMSRAGTDWLGSAAIVLMVIAVFAGAVFLAMRRDPVNPVWFVLVTVAVGLMMRAIYIASVEPLWTSDFLRYWQTALALADSTSYQINNIYEQRAMPFLVPLAEVFGDNILAVKIFNALLLATTQLAAYDILRRLHSHQAAQAFTVIWLAVPETMFSVALPSHDLTGVTLIAFILWLNVLATHAVDAARRWGLRAVSISVALALAFAYLEAARNLGTLLAVVFALCGVTGLILSWAKYSGFGNIRHVATVTLVQAVLGLVAIQASQALLNNVQLLMSAEALEAQVLRATTPAPNSMSDGSFAWYRGFSEVFSGEFRGDTERFRDFRTALNVSDFVERPAAGVKATFQRGERLFTLGSQYGFYHRGFSERQPEAALMFRYYNSLFSAVFAMFLMASLARLLMRPGPPQLYIPVLLVAGLALTCMTLLFNQPRYIYPIWLVGAIVVALEMARFRLERPSALAGLRETGLLVVQSALFLLCAAGLAWAGLALLYTTDRGRIISGWELSTDVPMEDGSAEFFSKLSNRTSRVVPIRDGRFYETQFGPLGLQLEFPGLTTGGESVTASRRVCAGGSRRLSFYYHMPYVRPERRGVFTLDLVQDGVTTWSQDLPGDGGTHAVSVLFQPNEEGCRLLEFRLTSNSRLQQESWRRASRTEIFFPRLETAMTGSDNLPK